MIKEVEEEVRKLLCADNSGHGMDHINRVVNLSLDFAEEEKANCELVALIALLHDVDDYKLFGEKNAEDLVNAKTIMKKVGVPNNMQQEVLRELKHFGYSKRLRGLIPTSLEGQIVSDADMCDALGANGIIRVHSYSIKHGKPFFDRNIFPLEEMTADQYSHRCADSSVCHMFEKILKVKNLMLTDAGKREAKKRQEITVAFLYNLFEEEKADEWIEYLNNYLQKEEENESNNDKTTMGNINCQKVKKL